MSDVSEVDSGSVWELFADHARDRMILGYGLRVELGNGISCRLWLNVESHEFVMEADGDGFAENVCHVDSGYLANFLRSGRIVGEYPTGDGLAILGELLPDQSGRYQPHPQFDDVDRDAVRGKLRDRYDCAGPCVGDWVRFSDGTNRRVSMVWGDGVQTAVASNAPFMLSGGGASFSGSLFGPVPKGSLVALTVRRLAEFWVFHHGQAGAGRGVHFRAPVRVWACGEVPPSC